MGINIPIKKLEKNAIFIQQYMHYYNIVIHPILKYTCTYPTQKLQSL